MWDVSVIFFFFFKQKTAYEMRISDWSSDVCSSDLPAEIRCAAPCDRILPVAPHAHTPERLDARLTQRWVGSKVVIVYSQHRAVGRCGGQRAFAVYRECHYTAELGVIVDGREWPLFGPGNRCCPYPRI